MRRRTPIVYLVIITLVVIYGAYNFSVISREKNEKIQELAEVKAEAQALKQEIAQLEKEIGEKDSLEFVEKVAREDLGMVKPREIVYIDRAKNDMRKDQEGNS
ncbi:septum formation initiator family protein [Peptoniphilus equinus]|uniref:Septum formation initiator family protein n=1 Tax=Peptoniphilus equinus TaxID=3016343 RepID=A0ABY7QTT8_9FIRM|nr:septum formation initiator family protein [Peptoniphilus equinus]WBW49499.1 septum formation initiator family protein [Peptoniphilus equinus]